MRGLTGPADLAREGTVAAPPWGDDPAPWPGGDQQETTRATACRRMPKVATVIVRKVGVQRPRAQPLSVVQPPYLLALGVPTTSLTVPQSG